ncbi:serine carboxypeptidase-like 7, partial [Syzygium oleosum]|uniref:serine carboxypeptidase-like 7 n=1 Tax=Syzygium oleosum TaxID=219896 RepID=UPI0024B8FB4B
CVSVLFLDLLLLSSEISGSAVESLPRFGPLPFELETGYIGVDEKDDVQLFYYFIPSEGNPQDDPLVLWLTGGPSCSALSGLIYEIGPLRFNKTKYDGRLPSLMLNPYSWTKVSSIIFLDAPVGTGFSYSTSVDGYETGDKDHARQSRIFLEKWLLSHPSFIENNVYITGDSYSGKVVPLIAREILEASNNILQRPLINLNGYLLGNPVTDSVFDEGSRIPFAYHKALTPKELYESAKRNCQGEYVRFNQTHLKCAEDLQTISECTNRVNKGHILEPKCDIYNPSHKLLESRRYMAEIYEDTWQAPPEIPAFHCRQYFDLLCDVWANDPAVQESLHVRQGILRSWVRCNRSLAYAHNVRSTVSHHLYLNSRGCHALIYSGDQDMVIPYLGTQSWINTLNLSIVDDWRPWMVGDQVAGFSREYSNGFTFATVKGGGHTAPEYLPEECFAMYKRWIHHEPL